MDLEAGKCGIQSVLNILHQVGDGGVGIGAGACVAGAGSGAVGIGQRDGDRVGRAAVGADIGGCIGGERAGIGQLCACVEFDVGESVIWVVRGDAGASAGVAVGLTLEL